MRKELKAAGGAALVLVGGEEFHYLFGMCATGIVIAILNDLKFKCAAAPMTRFVLNLELLLVVKDISKVKSNYYH